MPRRPDPRTARTSRSACLPDTHGGAEPRPYHHGDLRRALLDASLTIVRESGPAALTLRAAARAAGVSQTAPYRHFADRTALVAGVAEDGFRRLHARLVAAATAAIPAGSTARSGLQRLALEYLLFAVEHPAEYRIMFGEELTAHASGSLPASCLEARESVFALLRGGIGRLQEQRLVRTGDPRVMALSAWALVHGLAMLTIDGQVSRAADLTPEELATSATELMMFGMSAGS